MLDLRVKANIDYLKTLESLKETKITDKNIETNGGIYKDQKPEKEKKKKNMVIYPLQ